MRNAKGLIWRRVFDNAYRGNFSEGPATASWNSSFTGEPISHSEMEEYFGHTGDRLRSLPHAHVLEIGCGVGMILRELADSSEIYFGIDISPRAIEAIQSWIRPEFGFRDIRLSAQDALDAWQVEPGAVDLVILNSVAQYFPDTAYLGAILQRAFDVLAPTGCVFLGNIMDRRLAPAFHAAVALFRAPPGATLAELRLSFDDLQEMHNELSLGPHEIAALQRKLAPYGATELMLTRGRADNELTRYRYDAILRKTSEAEDLSAIVVEWSPEVSLEDLFDRIDPALEIRNVPNARLAREAALIEFLKRANSEEDIASFEHGLVSEKTQSVHPELFFELGERSGWAATVRPAENPFLFDVRLSRLADPRTG